MTWIVLSWMLLSNESSAQQRERVVFTGDAAAEYDYLAERFRDGLLGDRVFAQKLMGSRNLTSTLLLSEPPRIPIEWEGQNDSGRVTATVLMPSIDNPAVDRLYVVFEPPAGGRMPDAIIATMLSKATNTEISANELAIHFGKQNSSANCSEEKSVTVKLATGAMVRSMTSVICKRP